MGESKKVVINAEELIQLSDSLIELIKEIEEKLYTSFEYLYGTPFYEGGRCEEEIKRILPMVSRSEGLGMNIEKDLYGKLQMLSNYYSIAHRYCLDTICEYAKLDEQAAKYIQKLETSIFGGVSNE